MDFFLGKKRKQGSFDRGNSEGANQSQDGGDSGATTENEKIVAKRTPFTQLSSFKFRRELGRERLGGYLAESKMDGSLYALENHLKEEHETKRPPTSENGEGYLACDESDRSSSFHNRSKICISKRKQFVLRYALHSWGYLRELIKREGHLNIEWVVQYTSELVLAISHMHSLRMLYRDIKPHNVMIDAQGHINIIDFGLSKQDISTPRGAMSLVGTPDYSAPEVLKTACIK